MVCFVHECAALLLTEKACLSPCPLQGGLVVGFVHACFAAFMTRFTERVPVLEPIFVIFIGYLSYIVAEIFHFSGIIRSATPRFTRSWKGFEY